MRTQRERTYTAEEVAEAARQALDNWDFDAITQGNGNKQRKVLESVVHRGGFEVTTEWDVFDWMAEFAASTAADL